MLLFVSIVKAISEILILSLVGQGILWLIAGRARESNIVYRMFAAVTRPVMRLTRMLMPAFVLDRHIWMVAVLLVLSTLLVSGHKKLELCVGEAAASPLCARVVEAMKERRQAP